MFKELILALIIASQPIVTTADAHLEYQGTYTISAYSLEESPNAQTASGTTPRPYETVAAYGYDFGTELYIDGIGPVKVEDTGNFPRNRIDLFVGETSQEAYNFGLKDRRVYKIVRTEKTKGGKHENQT